MTTAAIAERLRELTPSLERPFDAPGAKDAAGARFAEMMAELVGQVNEKQNLAADNAAGLARGEVDMMETVVSLNEADLSLRMMMQIRDRAIDAYERVLRTL
ncbi:MAG: flagellar hook-basal body complex protein FliE [Spirochaetaceae bacterium]|nr:flagellar hook-basal body complex protein FliE [Myxococcales bacterium]MCB9726579.1 flagellar hook-basal body complex protein FliE [Spirochaetaceae bacterium]HPG26146.1 flagellar hook-basal body complex protein FliE [Myxococcota bacterium]